MNRGEVNRGRGQGEGRRRSFTCGSYEPLDSNESDSSETNRSETNSSESESAQVVVRDQAVAAFFQDVADMVFKGGPRGMELTAMDATARTFAFRHVAEPDPLPLRSEFGEVPQDDAERARVIWTPLPGSPAWAHLAFLLQELPFVSFFRPYGPEGGPALLGVESPGRTHADVLVEHRGERWRVRVRLEGREEPLEFPGMVIGELFGEGGHRDVLRDGVVEAGV